MNIKYIICAEGISTDKFSGRISIYNLFEEISAPGYPIALPGFYILVCAENKLEDEDEVSITIDISIDDQTLASYPMELAFADTKIARAIGDIQGFFISRPGLLSVVAKKEGAEIGRWEINCTQTAPAQIQVKE